MGYVIKTIEAIPKVNIVFNQDGIRVTLRIYHYFVIVC